MKAKLGDSSGTRPLLNPLSINIGTLIITLRSTRPALAVCNLSEWLSATRPDKLHNYIDQLSRGKLSYVCKFLLQRVKFYHKIWTWSKPKHSETCRVTKLYLFTKTFLLKQQSKKNFPLRLKRTFSQTLELRKSTFCLYWNLSNVFG